MTLPPQNFYILGCLASLKLIFGVETILKGEILIAINSVVRTMCYMHALSVLYCLCFFNVCIATNYAFASWNLLWGSFFLSLFFLPLVILIFRFHLILLEEYKDKVRKKRLKIKRSFFSHILCKFEMVEIFLISISLLLN